MHNFNAYKLSGFITHKIILLSLLLLCSEAFAQEFTHGAFGAIEIKNLSYKGETPALVGGRFGWVLDNTFVVGVGYYALTSHLKLDPSEAPDAEFNNMNYGGLDFEYLFNKDNFTASVSMLLGGGGISLFVPSDFPGKKTSASLDLLVYEPGINCGYTVQKWFIIFAGVSYREFTNLHGLYGISNKNLSGFSGSLSFRFGDFK